MHVQHLGAALALLCLLPVIQTETSSLQDPRFRALFLSYSSDGTYLYREQLQELLSSKFDEIQDLNDQLLVELMVFADSNQDGRLDVDEFITLAKYITKNRP
ncbi:uncharacterized protein LOC134023999 [Osmerus eperlanus]|uniref:uncharacterized protein LOC134023999 n=1 Tax=Osmerus eperlanus TaxID=29151 RepID=UPI002E0D41F2